MVALAIPNNTWRWDSRREKAAILLAEGTLTDEQIADDCAVGRDTLSRWKRIPEFQQRITEEIEAFRQRMLTFGFADKARRVQALNAVAVDIIKDLRDNDYKATIGVTADGIEIEGFDDRRVRQFRGCLDDIAKEMQERGTASASATSTASVVVKVYTDERMANPLEADWRDAPPPRSSADA